MGGRGAFFDVCGCFGEVLIDEIHVDSLTELVGVLNVDPHEPDVDE